jgi:hypothetical protein
MELKLTTDLKYPLPEIKETLLAALQNEIALAKLRRDEFYRECVKFEQKYHLSSDEFMKRFENGELGDDTDYFDWFAAKRGFDIWERRYQILKGVSL